MSDINFSSEEKNRIVSKLQTWFREELDQEIGGFDAEFLIDFFAGEIGGFFYNRGLYDAQALISQKVEELGEMVLELEKPVDV